MKSRFMAVVTVGLFLILMSPFAVSQWRQLKDDGLHDPSNPALKLLQEPAEALSVLQPDSAGNGVNWVTALQKGEISPRGNLEGDSEQETLDLDVVMTETYPLPGVIFPHLPHTQWMSCATCHESVFISKIGANPINMGRVLEGEYCGLCHGAVSFPLTECNRCHSVKRDNTYMVPSSGAIVEREP
jgi:c(7)-type cytochrome triheme protein